MKSSERKNSINNDSQTSESEFIESIAPNSCPIDSSILLQWLYTVLLRYAKSMSSR